MYYVEPASYRLQVAGMMLSHRLLVAGMTLAHWLLVDGMMLSHCTGSYVVAGIILAHRLLVVGVMLAPKSKCYVPSSFENETLLICIIYIQEKVHQSIPKADTGLP